MNTEENMQMSIYHELMEKYGNVLEKIENMELLLESQTQTLSEYSETFSDQYLKLLAKNIGKEEKISLNISKETFLEIKSKKLETQPEISARNELSTENIVGEVSCIKAEVLNVKRHLQLNGQHITESCKRLEKIETNLFDLFGKSGNQFSIYELIDFVVGINNSVNQMVEGFATSQLQIEMFRKEQKEVLQNVAEQKQILESHGTMLDNVLQKIESTSLTEVIY
jgi:hypothetical protein